MTITTTDIYNVLDLPCSTKGQREAVASLISDQLENNPGPEIVAIYGILTKDKNIEKYKNNT